MTHLIATNDAYLSWTWALTQLDAISTEGGYNYTPTVQTELPSGDVSAVTVVPEVGEDEVEWREQYAQQDYEIAQPLAVHVFVPAQSGATAELARRATIKAALAAVQDVRTALCSNTAALTASIPGSRLIMGSRSPLSLVKHDGGEHRQVRVTVNCAVTYKARMEW